MLIVKRRQLIDQHDIVIVVAVIISSGCDLKRLLRLTMVQMLLLLLLLMLLLLLLLLSAKVVLELVDDGVSVAVIVRSRGRWTASDARKHDARRLLRLARGGAAPCLADDAGATDAAAADAASGDARGRHVLRRTLLRHRVESGGLEPDQTWVAATLDYNKRTKQPKGESRKGKKIEDD